MFINYSIDILTHNSWEIHFSHKTLTDIHHLSNEKWLTASNNLTVPGNVLTNSIWMHVQHRQQQHGRPPAPWVSAATVLIIGPPFFTIFNSIANTLNKLLTSSCVFFCNSRTKIAYLGRLLFRKKTVFCIMLRAWSIKFHSSYNILKCFCDSL